MDAKRTKQKLKEFNKAVNGFDFLVYKNKGFKSKNTYTVEEVINSVFGDTADFFFKPLPKGKLHLLDLLKFMLSSISFSDAAGMTASMVLAGLFGLVLPLVSKYVYDIIIPSGNYNDILPIVILMMGISLSQFVLSITKRLCEESIINKMKLAFESASFHRLLMLPYDFFKRYPSGELTDYLSNIGLLCQVFCGIILTSALTSIFSFAYLLQIKILVPELFAPTLYILLILFVLIIIFVWREYLLQKRNLKLSAELFGFVNQIIKGIEKIKLFGAEVFVFAEWSKRYNEKLKAFISGRKIFSIKQAVFTVAVSLGALLIYYAASKREVSASDYIAFSIAYTAVVTVMTKFSQTGEQISLMLPILNSIMPIFEHEPEEGTGTNKNKIEPKGNIQIYNLSFAYENNIVIKNINLEVKSGEYIGIVGGTGCGKSTLLKLMLGLEKAKTGSIYYDEHSIDDVDIIALRQRIGTVMQNGKMIHDTIFENIIAGNSSLSVEDVFEAAEIAGIAEDIKKMPMGMFTVIPQSGGGISEGQAQRILIARAIVNRPKILFFDEATSALDNITQKAVIGQIEKIDCTKIIIAHRLTTVINCDKIIVMDNGELVQQGTYNELLNSEGLFKTLARRQTI